MLAGKEGQAEARRVLPGLLAWVSKESSRVAVWHSAQIIKHVERGVDTWNPVAVYQAALLSVLTSLATCFAYIGFSLWAYGILTLGIIGHRKLRVRIM